MRKVGRPRSYPKSALQLIQAAQQSIHRSAERRHDVMNIDVETFCHRISHITGKHKFTKEAMYDIRRKVDILYEKFVHDKWEQEAMLYRPFARFVQAAQLQMGKCLDVREMSPEEWNKEHDLRPDGSRKRGQKPKLKKAIWDILPGEFGTSKSLPVPLDINALEQKYLEDKYMSLNRSQVKRNPMTIGKRYRSEIHKYGQHTCSRTN